MQTWTFDPAYKHSLKKSEVGVKIAEILDLLGKAYNSDLSAKE